MSKKTKAESKDLFIYLISTFQSSALIALGEVKNPMTEKIKVNIKQASYYIDLLDMVKNKMESNLTDYEEQILINTISDLRLKLINKEKTLNV